MKKILFIFPLLLIFSLSSCQKKVLREDIANFINKFSITEAVEAYKKVEMNKVNITKIDDETSKILEEISFDITDVNNPIYHRSYKTYENDVLKEEKDEYIKIVDDKYYLVTDDNEKESTLEECHLVIERFFYKEIVLDGTYYTKGYYYGDDLRYNAYDFQNFITIDNENNVLNFSACQDYKNTSGDIVTRCSKYSVDAYGMLLNEVATSTVKNNESKTEIEIKRL